MKRFLHRPIVVSSATATICIMIAGAARVAPAQQPAACGEACTLVVVSPSAVFGTSSDTALPRTIGWFFVPHLPALDAATGPARLEYHRAQRLYRRASIVAVVGVPAILGVLYFSWTDPEKRPWGWKAENQLVALAIGAELIDIPMQARAAEHLSRAAWLYSRPAAPAPPRADGCTYDRCALRFRYRAWSSHLVQGLDGPPVAESRELFAYAGDSARAHYGRYLELHRGSQWRYLFVLTALFASTAAFHSSDEEVRGVGAGLLAAGYVVGQLSLWSALRERDELQRAIWLYNNELAAGR
jgi:hypothetical protein